jgi:predicted HTH transcriptional regulator
MVAELACRHHDERGFWARFGRVEHESLEFKESPYHVREVIPAMAMSHGGEIVLGVSDDRRLVGCPLDQRTLDAVTRRAREAAVDVSIAPLRVGAVHLTLVTVPRVGDRIVTTSDGRLLRRVGSDNVPLVGDEVARFVVSRTRRGARVRRLLDLLRATA